jgi:hypothetical protein
MYVLYFTFSRTTPCVEHLGVICRGRRCHTCRIQQAAQAYHRWGHSFQAASQRGSGVWERREGEPGLRRSPARGIGPNSGTADTAGAQPPPLGQEAGRVTGQGCKFDGHPHTERPCPPRSCRPGFRDSWRQPASRSPTARDGCRGGGSFGEAG